MFAWEPNKEISHRTDIFHCGLVEVQVWVNSDYKSCQKQIQLAVCHAGASLLEIARPHYAWFSQG